MTIRQGLRSHSWVRYAVVRVLLLPASLYTAIEDMKINIVQCVQVSAKRCYSVTSTAPHCDIHSRRFFRATLKSHDASSKAKFTSNSRLPHSVHTRPLAIAPLTTCHNYSKCVQSHIALATPTHSCCEAAKLRS